MTTNIDVRPWPEVQAALPPLSPEERHGLAALISERGVLSPVLVMPDGRIIDGHNRWAFSEGGAKFEVVDVDEETGFLLALGLNVHRRQLSAEGANDFRRMMKENPIGTKRMIAEMSERGQTQQEIATATGYAQSRVSAVLKEVKTSPLISADKGRQPGADGQTGHEHRRKIPVEDAPAIRRRLDGGEKITAIAREYGAHATAVRRFLDRRERTDDVRPGPPNVFTAEQSRDVERRYRAGEAMTSLAEAYGCSKTTVSKTIAAERATWPNGVPPGDDAMSPTVPTNVVGFSAKREERRQSPAVPPARTYAPETVQHEARRWLKSAQNVNKDQLRGMRNRMGDAFVAALAGSAEGELLARELTDMADDFRSLADDIQRATNDQEDRRNGRFGN